MKMTDIIYKKREGHELKKEEIEFFINGYIKGDIPDYQASALLMAIHFKNLNSNEIFNLTDAMKNSGNILDLSKINGIKVDKHSTGGVGDKTTLIVAPLVASCLVPVAKMSGRGLGFTGGTIDKLESIPGFKVEMDSKEFINTVNNIKLALISQTENIAIADKKLYALRDVTTTVDNIGLIASSIMSKKLASGSDAILLDVKCGSGAFMKDIESALELGKCMVDIGSNAKKATIAIVTDMNQPLGNAVGNSLEVIEAIDILKNKGPEDIRNLCINLAGYMLILAKKANNLEEANNIIKNNLQKGYGLEKFKEFIKNQGGDESIIDDYEKLPTAKYMYEVKSDCDGYVSKINTQNIGKAALHLGAGRMKKEDNIDLSAGIIILKKINDKVNKGDIIAKLYTNKKDKFYESNKIVLDSYEFSSKPNNKNLLIKAIITKENIKLF